MFQKCILIFLIMPFGLAVASPKRETHLDFTSLAKSKSWKRILYFKKDKSEVFEKAYFLTPYGNTNSGEELEALSAEILSSYGDKSPVICKFPARSLVAGRLIGKEQMVRKSIGQCQKLNEFVVRANAYSASLVFSSYYLHNPSSAFGHTLLKINRSEKQDQDLLSYGINYAATVDTNNSLIYAFKGLFGFFNGEFTAIPYYYKVREYNDFESRDLWSFDLNLSDKELELLILHIWELDHAASPYFYLTKNCSYWMLRLIETVKIDVNLTDDLNSLYLIPIDTVKAVTSQNDLVRTVSIRPSLRRKVLNHFTKLNSNQVDQALDLVKRMRPGPAPTKDIKALDTQTLEASIDLFDYKYASEFLEHEKELQRQKLPLLAERAKRDGTDEKADDYSHVVAPHLFHPTSQVSVYGQKRNDVNSYIFRWKPSMQDLFDPHEGFDPYSTINFFDISVRYNDNADEETLDNFQIDQFDLIRVGVFTPWTRLDKKTSWIIRGGITDLFWENCEFCQSGYISLSGGLSLKPFQNSSIVYLMINQQLDYSGQIEQDHLRFAAGPHVGTLLHYSKNVKSQMDFKYLALNRFAENWKGREVFEHTHQAYFDHESLPFAILIKGLHLQNVDELTVGLKVFY